MYAVGILCGITLSVYQIGADVAYPDFDLAILDGGGAIIFMGSDNIVGDVINASTGGGGFCHCAIYPAITDPDGVPLLIESRGGEGVGMRPLHHYDGRLVAYYPLDERETIHVRGASMALLGRPYRLRSGGVHCADLVYACLPPDLRRHLAIPRSQVTPNGLAEALGITVEMATPMDQGLVDRVSIERR